MAASVPENTDLGTRRVPVPVNPSGLASRDYLDLEGTTCNNGLTDDVISDLEREFKNLSDELRGKLQLSREEVKYAFLSRDKSLNQISQSEWEEYLETLKRIFVMYPNIIADSKCPHNVFGILMNEAKEPQYRNNYAISLIGMILNRMFEGDC